MSILSSKLRTWLTKPSKLNLETLEGREVPASLIGFSSASYAAFENAGTFNVTVTRSGDVTDLSIPESVDYSVLNGSGILGTDYSRTGTTGSPGQALSGTLTFNATDTTKTIQIRLLNTPYSAIAKTINFGLTNIPITSSPGTVNATLSVSDAAPGLPVITTIVPNNVSNTVTITVARQQGSFGALNVPYTTVNGTAIAGVDYTATAGTLSWADGDAASQQIVVPANISALTGVKTFDIDLGNTAITKPSVWYNFDTASNVNQSPKLSVVSEQNGTGFNLVNTSRDGSSGTRGSYNFSQVAPSVVANSDGTTVSSIINSGATFPGAGQGYWLESGIGRQYVGAVVNSATKTNVNATVNFTGSIALDSSNNPTRITNISTANLAAGATVTGSDIAPGTTISSVIDATTIQLNKSTISALTITVANAAGTIADDGAGNFNQLTLTSTTGLTPGAAISGTNIPGGTTILSITNGTTLVLSQNATATGATTIASLTYSNIAGTINPAAPNQIIGMTSTTPFPAGSTISGRGVPGGTTISSVLNSTTLVLSQSGDSTGTLLTFTRTNVGGTIVDNGGNANKITGLPTVVGLQVGASITGTNITAGTTIASVDTTNGFITISQNGTLGSTTIDSLAFTVSAAIDSTYLNKVSVSNASLFPAGTAVSGPGIPGGTTVLLASGLQLALSNNASAATSTVSLSETIPWSVNIQTQTPHKLMAGQIVNIGNLNGTANPGINNTSAVDFRVWSGSTNGNFIVSSVVNANEFTYSTITDPGTWTNKGAINSTLTRGPFYEGASTTLVSSIGTSETTITVKNSTALPTTYPYFIQLTTPSTEFMRVKSATAPDVNGNVVLTVDRGADIALRSSDGVSSPQVHIAGKYVTVLVTPHTGVSDLADANVGGSGGVPGSLAYRDLLAPFNTGVNNTNLPDAVAADARTTTNSLFNSLDGTMTYSFWLNLPELVGSDFKGNRYFNGNNLTVLIGRGTDNLAAAGNNAGGVVQVRTVPNYTGVNIGATVINDGLGNPTLLTVPSTVAFDVGALVSGAGIPGGTTVVAKINSTTLQLSQPATLGSTTVSIDTSYSLTGIPEYTFELRAGQTSGTSIDRPVNTKFKINEWNNFVISYTPTATLIYKNGVLTDTVATIREFDGASNKQTVNEVGGAFRLNNTAYNTTIREGGNFHIDDLGLWNKQLTASEVAALYNKGIGNAMKNTATVVLAATKLTNVQIGDGTGQRSTIRSITLTFDRAINTVNPGAISITTQAGAPIAGLNVNVAGTGTNTLTLTFSDTNPNDSVNNFDSPTYGTPASTGPVTFGSLVDGLYRLNINGASMVSGGVAVDAFGTGTAGSSKTQDFHRLFGDKDGDQTVGTFDYFPSLINAINKELGEPGFDAAWDYDNDDVIGTFDFFPHLVNRFNAEIF